MGHVDSMGETRTVYKFLVARPEGSKPLQKRMRIGQDNIKWV
jgi:hypothetical protein